MATITFGSAVTFDFLVDAHWSQRTSQHAEPGSFYWMVLGNRVTFLSDLDDIEDDGSDNVTAGTATGLELDLGNDSTVDLTITGLSLDLVQFIADLQGVSSVGEEKNLFWRTLLGGDDTIHLGSPVAPSFEFAGDGRYVEPWQVLFAGNDTIDGTTIGDVSGDYAIVIGAGIAFGGDDTMTVDAHAASGDAYEVQAGGFLQGGNDTISTPNATSLVIGDAAIVLGILVGGNDTISAANALQTFGDAWDVQTGGQFVGGNDSITGGSGADTMMAGDAGSIANGTAAQGGNDTIRGGGGNDVIYGDFVNVSSGNARGGHDLLFGDTGDDLILAGGGNDTITGGADRDQLYGEAGDDLFIVELAADVEAAETYDGGAGTDTLSIGNGGASYSISFRQVEHTSIERLVYRSAGTLGTANVTITYAQFANAAIVGNSVGNGTDTLTIVAGPSSAILDLRYFYALSNFSDAGEHVNIVGDEDSEIIIGTLIDDSITGGDNVDYLSGADGDDTIVGGAGVDNLAGNDGDDVFQLFEGEDVDYIEGGANTDTLDLSGLASTTNATVNLETSLWSISTIAGAESIFQVENVTGGAGNDTITGSNVANTLRGGAGDDQIHTQWWNITAGEIYDGGTGAGDVLVIDTPGVTDPVFFADLRSVTLLGFETLVIGYGDDVDDTAVAQIKSSQIGAGISSTATIASADTTSFHTKEVLEITMDTASINLSQMTIAFNANFDDFISIMGRTLSDTIIGSSGKDAVNAGSGNDTVLGGAGVDTLNGSIGIDTADYSDKLTKVTIALNVAGNATVVVTGGETESIYEFENLIGGSGADSFTGNQADNIFRGGLGKDVMDGLTGKDTADYSDKHQKVTVTLNTTLFADVFINGTANINKEDRIKNFENVTGGSAGDNLTGDILANILVGNGGVDTLNGGKGNDTLNGGGSADKFVFSTTLSANANVDTIVSFAHNSDVIQLDDAIFGAIGPTLATNEFLKGAGKTSGADANDFIIYNTSNGRLYYDKDGKGGAASVHFATLDTKPATLDAGDFAIV